jgi:hypothetical protein
MIEERNKLVKTQENEPVTSAEAIEPGILGRIGLRRDENAQGVKVWEFVLLVLVLLVALNYTPG